MLQLRFFYARIRKLIAHVRKKLPLNRTRNFRDVGDIRAIGNQVLKCDTEPRSRCTGTLVSTIDFALYPSLIAVRNDPPPCLP
jgi:hypothetical protein